MKGAAKSAVAEVKVEGFAREYSNTLSKGSLSYPHIVLMVLASAAPMVVVPGYIPLSISFGAGMVTPLVYALATLILLTFSVGYVEMAKRITSAGAFYTFVSQGVGKIFRSVSRIRITFLLRIN